MSTLLSLAFRLAVLRRLYDAPGPLDPSGIEKILVIRNDNIGDVVCTTPLLDALRAAFPGAHLAALVCTLTEEVWRGHPALDRLYAYPKASHGHYGKLESLARLRRVQKEIAAERFDLVLAVRSTYSSNLARMAFASRARWRMGPASQEDRHRKWGFFLNLTLEKPPREMHEVDRCLRYARMLGAPETEKSLRMTLPPEARERAADFWRLAGTADPGRAALINLTRPPYSPGRQWPKERFRELARSLAAAGWPVAAVVSPAESAWTAGLFEGLPAPPPVFVSRGLAEFAALAAGAALLVTPEGGSMHLAAAAGAPCVVLWSTTPQTQWRPWGVPCRLVGGDGPLAEVTVDRVLQAVSDLGAELGREPGSA